MLEVNEELLKAIEGFYADGDCGAYLSIAKISDDNFLWCIWNRKSDIRDEEGRITYPIDYRYEKSQEMAETIGWKVLEENRPPDYRKYFIGKRWNGEKVYLQKTTDTIRGGNSLGHLRYRMRQPKGEAAWEFHRRLIAERKSKRKRKVGASQAVEYVYVHYTYTREYFDRTASSHRRKRINLKDGWSYHEGSEHQTDQYRVVQKTDRYIYLQGKPVAANDFESFQDYRDHQARRYRLDRSELDTAGMTFHSRLGWVSRGSVHPESAVPDTVSALLGLECFTLLGITTICGDAEVKKAYRKKVKGLHPDSPEMIGKSDAEFREATLKFMAVGKARDDVLDRLKTHRKRKAKKGKNNEGDSKEEG
jgi:hypothetical protein